jgi:chaperonin GroES
MNETFPFIPFNDGVVIKVDEAPETTAGGLIIPAQAREQMQTATVMAVGPGGFLPDGSRAKMSAQVGQMVFIKKFTGHKLNIDGVEYLVTPEEHILGGLTPEYQEKQKLLTESRRDKKSNGLELPEATGGSMMA